MCRKPLYVPQFFALDEFLRSDTAVAKKIENIPSWEIIEHLRELARFLDILRMELGIPITVTSGFRSEKLNKEVKGSKTSQHLYGEAADLKCADNTLLFNTAKRLMEEGKIEVGQLIWEYGTKTSPDWVHISIPNGKHHNEVLYIGI